MTKATGQQVKRHYKDIAFLENRARLRLLRTFHDLVIRYFDHSTLNMMSGEYVEKPEARDARDAINRILMRVYTIIRHADIKTYTASTSSVSVSGRGQNMDLILNIFKLGRNEIDTGAPLDYIERAIDVYKSNRLSSLLRTLNPFFWISVAFRYR